MWSEPPLAPRSIELTPLRVNLPPAHLFEKFQREREQIELLSISMALERGEILNSLILETSLESHLSKIREDSSESWGGGGL